VKREIPNLNVFCVREIKNMSEMPHRGSKKKEKWKGDISKSFFFRISRVPIRRAIYALSSFLVCNYFYFVCVFFYRKSLYQADVIILTKVLQLNFIPDSKSDLDCYQIFHNKARLISSDCFQKTEIINSLFIIQNRG
jgi:hypothetical protein